MSSGFQAPSFCDGEQINLADCDVKIQNETILYVKMEEETRSRLETTYLSFHFKMFEKEI